MKICFLARPSFDYYSPELFNRLKQKDSKISGVFITTNKNETNRVQNRINENEDYSIFETATYLREHWNEFNNDQLTYYEKKYECAPIWKYIYTDRFLIYRDYEYCIKITAGLFSFFEFVFSETKPQYYYSECIATLQCYIAFLVGKKYGVQYITQMCARGNLDSIFHYFTVDPHQFNMDLIHNYLEETYSTEEWKIAKDYLKEFESKDSPPPAMGTVRTKPKIDRSFILAPLKYLKQRMNPNCNDPYSYMYYQSYTNCLNPIVFYFRYRKCKKYYKSPDYTRKYIFFPLHFQPEASTCVCAEKYEKQLFFIDSWAKSLPADTVLYVKEHYALLGHRDPSFYEELKKYPNVFLIDPWESSRKLIENSFVVTTLTGTAGYEAMLLRKPVFIGGDCVFDNAPGIIKINDIFQKFLPSINEWKKPERTDVIKYLCACFRTYHKGNIYCQNFEYLLDGNIDDIVDALYQKLLILNGGTQNDLL